jgi:hypothetical protein
MGGMSSSWDDYRSSSYDWDSSSSVTKKSAASYAKEDKRKYTGTTSSGIAAPINQDIVTKSKLASILVVDVTGSMQEWPGQIFKKMATLYNESNAAFQGVDLDSLKKGQQLEDLLDMSVIAVGDAYCDAKAVQVVDFSKGPDLVKGVNQIYPEGGGGPFGRESYELVAYYLDNHCKVPKGVKPVVIFACDEDFYKTVKPSQVKKYFGDTIGQSLNSDKIIQDLTKKFDVYALRPEPSGPSFVYENAQKHWESILGKQKVLKMDDPARLVDCVIGISAYAADNFDTGKDMLERRQTPEQVKQVLETLHPLLGKKGGK